MIDVSRMQGCITVLLNTRPSPIKGKHLIQLSQVDDKLIGHQIAAKGNLCGGMAFATKHPLQEGGVEYNITVIGNKQIRSEEHTSELQSRPHLVCRLLLEKKK